MTDPYQVLGISPSASDEEVKEAYRKLSQQYHPDMQSGNSVMEDIANEKMADINAAYDEIMNQRRSNTGIILTLIICLKEAVRTQMLNGTF